MRGLAERGPFMGGKKGIRAQPPLGREEEAAPVPALFPGRRGQTQRFFPSSPSPCILSYPLGLVWSYHALFSGVLLWRWNPIAWAQTHRWAPPELGTTDRSKGGIRDP